MERIEREEYLEFLKNHKDKQIIKVVSGIRRAGKSTLFEIYKDYLQKNGVEKNQIISINFEDLEYEEYTDYKKLYKFIKDNLLENKKNYIFLDEIQHVNKFEKVVDSLFIKENVDLYITGSNAYFMSGELATLLSGRYVELEILPLSFKEYCEGKKQQEIKKEGQELSKSLMQRYNDYIFESSFPYTLQIDKKENIREYLMGIYNSVLLKDVVSRLKISVVKYMFDNIGNITAIKKIVDAMTSLGRKIDVKTVEKYLSGLIDSMILYKVNRYNIKGKAYLSNLSKYYIVDIGLRNQLLGNRNIDFGHIFENIIYLELLRREKNVYIGQFGDKEVDFVVLNGEKVEYYQVALTVLDENTLKRELEPLKKIKDSYPKYLITLDEIGVNTNYDGIKVLNGLDWLVDRGDVIE